MLDTPASYEYTTFAYVAGQDYIVFDAKGPNDAHIALSEGADPYSANMSMYEICIGGWSNGKSTIR